MRRYYFIILVLVVVFGGIPNLAYGATYSADTNLTVSSYSLIIEAGSSAYSLTVNPTTLEIILTAGDSFVITSTDKKDFTVSGGTNAGITKTLYSDKSGLRLNLATGNSNETLTVTVLSTVLTGNSATTGTSGAGSTSSGGGGGSRRSTKKKTTTETDETTETAETADSTGAGSTKSAREIQLDNIFSESIAVRAGKAEVLASAGKTEDTTAETAAEAKYIAPLVSSSGAERVSAGNTSRMVNFVNYGTETTLRLGAGERAGVLYCFEDVHGRLPESEDDWDDVLKIANGRWPKQTSASKETAAEKKFKEIYLREPDRTNPHDDAAVVIITYGLKPFHRGLDNERAAIKTFKYLYNKLPVTNLEWKMIRAIAESGATR